ncbi:MAG: succinyl-diaminopimelate desuccinylase [Kordiimonas sp.]|nr:succinyl-diaminopimelate desuccinylase [Kordiimonas sp.]|tara:strand:+ start:1192 stop:2382 length:1191 start_codon:yes stop_codon:yes gene_type:complete
MSLPLYDAVKVTQDLVRCPSVTPANAGALDVLQQALEALGFVCTRLPFSEEGTDDVDNLYARLGTAGPNFCFAGHTDVVPVGDAGDWSHDPFAATISDGRLHGRGVVDMKGAIGAFVAATSRLLREKEASSLPGSISFLITGDEEGVAINGTVKMLQWLEEQGEELDFCLVGEPTNPSVLGDMIKIGRRGSMNGWITVAGTQGHVAYPHLADNPIPRLLQIMNGLDALPLDQGNDHFQPSNLEITEIEVGNTATNVIPAEAKCRFNIRFNTEQTADDLITQVQRICDAVKAQGPEGSDVTCKVQVSGDAFLTPPGYLSDLIAGAVGKVTGQQPALSTTGGTSDARFIKNYCPVSEFGLISQTMHKVDEQVAVSDIEKLADIYTEILRGFFDENRAV